MVFVDTSAWFALFVSRDSSHAVIRGWIDDNDEQLLTSDYCVDETLTLLMARKRQHLALEAGEDFFNQRFARLVFLNPAQIHRAWALFKVRYCAGWSFTDCTSAVLMSDLGIRKALALDDHFRQFDKAEVVP